MVSLFKAVFRSHSQKNISRLAAALAYYSVISLAPLLVLIVVVLEFFFVDAQTQLLIQLEQYLEPVVYVAVTEILHHTAKLEKRGLVMVISITILVFGSIRVFMELHDSFNTIWGVGRRFTGVKDILYRRFFSLAMVAILGLIIISLLILSSVFSELMQKVAEQFDITIVVIHNFFSLASLTLLFAALFKVIPDSKVAWKDVWLGALLTAVFFNLGRLALGFYLAEFSFSSAYGAAGSLAALLIWIYYSSQIIFMGLAYCHAYAHRYGSRR